MKLKMFSIFDSKVQAYMAPVFLRSTGEAERAFSASVADQSSNFCKFPEDFTLFEVGSWDDQTCVVDLLPTPHPVAKAIQFIKS